ncbi:unnamed protein product [Effrenium voratum]|uniref:Uncharacterized protein n=1 Tax=Effrenium voratum TaxID=2562239 RepID=A0AA36IA01_9DINO|nr:unnamed protein product [Effrenium voratum]
MPAEPQEVMDADSALKRVPAIKQLEQALEQKSQMSANSFKAKVGERLERARKKAQDIKTRTVTIVKEPEFQKLTISTGTGVIVLGACGGAFGIATGVVLGSAAGVAPALATFGLSIPAGAICGGAAGLLIGTTAGSTAGGAGGFCLYKYRVQIKDGVIQVKVKALNAFEAGRDKAKGTASRTKLAIESTAAQAREKANVTVALAKEKSTEAVKLVKAKAGDAFTYATSTRTGVSSVSALLGGAVGTATGGACGALAGGAVGMVPAIFTFGLSIPVGATIGLVAGATTAGGAGAVGGGAVGFAGFTYREEIQKCGPFETQQGSPRQRGVQKRGSASYLHKKGMDSAEQVKSRVKSLVGAGTGGTA